MIKTECPQCGRSLSVPDSEVGLTAVCNACGRRIIVLGQSVPLSSVPSLASLWEALGTPPEPGGSPADATASAIDDMLRPPPPAPVPPDGGMPNQPPIPHAGPTKTDDSPPGGGDDTTTRGFSNEPVAAPSHTAPRSPVSTPPPQPALLRPNLDDSKRPVDKVQVTLFATSLVCTLLVMIVVGSALRQHAAREAADGGTPTSRIDASPDGWDVAHRDQIRRIVADADERLIAGDLPGADRAYDRLNRYVAGHAPRDPALRADVDRALANRRQVERALARRAEERANALAAAPADAPPRPEAVEPAPAPASRPAMPAVPASGPTPADTRPPPRGGTVNLPALTVTPQPITADPMSERSVNLAIQRGVDWMLSRYNAQTGALLNSDNGGHIRAETALCTYALLQAGLAVSDQRLDIHGNFTRAALAHLVGFHMEEESETYGRGLRASALSLYHRPSDAQALQADLGWLLRSQKAGAYSYGETQTKAGNWDNSNSQYGLLGAWAAAEAGLEVPGPYWKTVQDHWVKQQATNGSWGYNGGGAGDSLTMTCAALASLFVTYDYLEPAYTGGGSGEAVGRAPLPPAIVNGLRWLEQQNHLAQAIDSGYALYGVERVGLASGFKFLGGRDWYRELGRALLTRQAADGSWGDRVETSFALLFLARGSHPLLMNKLRFDGAWANRPRDVSHLARFASRAMERPLNWQVVDADRQWTDWADAPVLYLASHERPHLDEGEVDQIRRYVQAGNLLFTQADGNKQAFDAFARDLAKRLFPDYPMTELPPDHELYTVVFPIDPMARPPLWGVSNGSRLLMVHSPTDLAAGWQMRAERQRPANFQLGVNLFVYATGKGELRRRLSTTNLPDPAPPTGGLLTVARLRHDGNWDPEPAAWPRFNRWFTQQTNCGVNTVVIDLARIRPDIAPVAHLTSTSAFTPSEADLAALRQYVDAGGTLLVDTCGGQQPTAQSLATLLAHAFPDATLHKLPATHPLFAATVPGTEPLPVDPTLRPFTLRQQGKGAGVPEGFTHGSGQVIFCSLDLTSGLLGAGSWGVAGYDPDYAQALLKNILLWSVAGRPDGVHSAK